MNVYKFRLSADYGDGLAIIAANDREQAKELAHELNSGLGYWEICYTIKDLVYNGEPRVIEYEYYQE